MFLRARSTKWLYPREGDLGRILRKHGSVDARIAPQ